MCSVIQFPRLSGYFCGKLMCAVMRGLTVLTVEKIARIGLCASLFSVCLGHDRLGESRASALRVSVIVWANPIESGTWSGIRPHRPPHREWLEWKWALPFLDSFHRIFVRHAYILRTIPLFCSIGPALLGPHRLPALNTDSPIDDTPSTLVVFSAE